MLTTEKCRFIVIVKQYRFDFQKILLFKSLSLSILTELYDTRCHNYVLEYTCDDREKRNNKKLLRHDEGEFMILLYIHMISYSLG